MENEDSIGKPMGYSTTPWDNILGLNPIIERMSKYLNDDWVPKIGTHKIDASRHGISATQCFHMSIHVYKRQDPWSISGKLGLACCHFETNHLGSRMVD